MYFTLKTLSVVSGFLLASVTASKPQVNLGYATYEGVGLSNGVNQFLGMRYAASPTGQRRFRRPEPPLSETGLVQATEHGPICYGVDGLAFENAPITADEDCLFIDVYTPAAASNNSGSALPVMLWLQGGAFVQLFNPNYNGTGLVEASDGNVIIVSFNYRVGAYGFLASEELKQENNLNIGIHDQRAAMAWVQQHIAQFGGNPEKVTLFGTSVGGGSVLLQTLAYGGNPPKSDGARWSSGIAGAIYLPPSYNVADLEFQYKQILNATNCTDLACLRSLSSDAMQAANLGRPTFPSQETLPLFPYGPVIDGDLYTDHPHSMLKSGKFSKDRPLILGSSHTEGTLFVPQANTTEDVNTFLKTQFPGLTEGDLAIANSLYATVPQTFPGVAGTKSPLYYRLAKMYGDLVFSCPALEFAAGISAAGAPVHLFRTHIVDEVELEAGYIVPHTWELQAVWGPEYATSFVALPGADSYNIGGANRASVEEVQKYWLSYVETGGNPNAHKEKRSPAWKKFGLGQRLMLQTNATKMETVPLIEIERCAFWAGVSARTHI